MNGTRRKIRVEREAARGCDGCGFRCEVSLVTVGDKSMRVCRTCTRKLVTAIDHVAIGDDAYEVLA